MFGKSLCSRQGLLRYEADDSYFQAVFHGKNLGRLLQGQKLAFVLFVPKICRQKYWRVHSVTEIIQQKSWAEIELMVAERRSVYFEFVIEFVHDFSWTDQARRLQAALELVSCI